MIDAILFWTCISLFFYTFLALSIDDFVLPETFRGKFTVIAILILTLPVTLIFGFIFLIGKKLKIKEAINLLKEVDITPELMEDILEELGLRDMVLNQILESERYLSAEKTWNDIFNNETLIYDEFSRYYVDKHLN